MNDELPEATSRPVLDKTTNNVDLEGHYLQTRSESDNGHVAKPSGTETQPSISLAQTKLDKTECMDVLPAPEQKNVNNANDSKDTVHALPTAPPTDDSNKTIRGKENSKWQNLKTCIIQLTELSKAE